MKKRGEDKSKKSRSDKLENRLIENMIEMQKLNVKMIEKFDNLSSQISGLLNLFETTARTFASSPNVDMATKDKEFLDKIDKLLDQNKTLAKGLTLMEEKLREKVYGQSSRTSDMIPSRRDPGQLEF